MMIFGREVSRETWFPVACFLVVLVLCLGIALVAECASVDTHTISGATVFGFEGAKQMVEVATEDATVTYEIEYLISGSWADLFPDSTSPAGVFTVFAGMSDRWSWTYGGSVTPDSTRVIVTPAAATDVTVRMQ